MKGVYGVSGLPHYSNLLPTTENQTAGAGEVTVTYLYGKEYADNVKANLKHKKGTNWGDSGRINESRKRGQATANKRGSRGRE